MGKRFVTRILLLLILVFCVWGRGDFSWWLRRFKNGGL